MRKITVLVMLLIYTAAGRICAQAAEGGYVDTHVHFNAESKQRGGEEKKAKGGKKQQEAVINYDDAAGQLLAEMDEYGVEKAIIMPPPQVKTQGNVCDYRNLIGITKKYPGRLYFLGGGDNLNRLIHHNKPEEVTTELKAQFKKTAEEIIDSGAKGFGEFAALHLSLISSHHAFEETSPDHPLFLLLADIAASRNVPIDFHMEAVPRDMELPESLNKDGQQNPPVLKANIPGFERLLAHNRNAKVVWQHIGWDNTGCMTVELLRRLLGAHPNLYLSIRGEKSVYDRTGKLRPNRILAGDGKINPEWLKLMGDFPDRFMVGTDSFYGSPIKTSKRDTMPRTTDETWGMIIKQLPPDLAKKIGRDNAVRVYRLE